MPVSVPVRPPLLCPEYLKTLNYSFILLLLLLLLLLLPPPPLLLEKLVTSVNWIVMVLVGFCSDSNKHSSYIRDDLVIDWQRIV